jgi:tetratricopeptide (TPR) repeat protein
MNKRSKMISGLLAASVMGSVLAVYGQEIVPGDFSGTPSVFLWRRAAKVAPRRFTSAATTTVPKSRRIESARSVRQQYIVLAKAKPRRKRSDVVDPNDRRLADFKRLPRDQASRLFAGVGEYYMDRDDFDHAIDFFRESVSLDDKNTNGKLGLSEALALKGNDVLIRDGIPVAKPFFEEALKYNDKNAPAYFGLAEAYSEQNMRKEAIENYEAAIKNDPDLTEIYTPLGILYFQERQTPRAKELLTKALATSSANTDPQLQYFIGLIRYNEKDYTKAIEAFRKSYSIDPKYAEAYYQAGETLSQLNKNQEAVAEYTKAIELKPNFFDPWLGLGSAQFELNNYPEAIKAYKEAVRIDNRSIEAYTNLGDANRLGGNFNDAEAAYTLATTFIEQDPKFNKTEAADTYVKISYVIAKQCEISSKKGIPCRWDNAVRALEKAVAITGSNVDRANLGWAYYNAGRTDMYIRNDPNGAKVKLEKAKDNLERSVFEDSNFVEAPLLNLAITLTDLGDTDGAINALKRVLAKKPNWVFALNELGIAYRKQNNFKEAASYFRRAVSSDGKYVVGYYNLAETEFRAGNLGEAKKAYQKVRQLNRPDLAAKLELLTGGAIKKG